MKNKIKKFLCLCLTAALCFSLAPVSAFAAQEQNTETTATEEASAEPALPESYYWPIQSNEIEGWPAGPQVQAETAIVMEASTGAILYSKNMDETRYPASITKIMTTLLAIENCSLDEQVTFSENAIWGIERDSSHIGIKIGEVLTMEQCLYGMMLASANEVCIAVAEHIAGSVDAFAEMMNEKAAELGCTNTHFVNANGLHDDNHYTTAHDMALISQAALQNETFRQITGSTYYIVPTTNLTPDEERWLNNHHKMLLDGQYHYDGCIGGKTGYTSIAGNTLVTFAERDGIQLICVVMKNVGAAIYTDTAALLDYGFASFQKVTFGEAETLHRPEFLDCEFPLLRDFSDTTIGNTATGYGAMIPLEASADTLVTENSVVTGQKLTTYTYNGQLAGRIVTQIDSVLPELAEENADEGDSETATPETEAETESNAEEAVPENEAESGEEETTTEDEVSSESDSIELPEALELSESLDSNDLLSAFNELPAWKYPVLLILVWAILFYLITIIIHIRRKRRDKTARQKDEEFKETLHESDEPFLTEEKILDESLLPKEEEKEE